MEILRCRIRLAVLWIIRISLTILFIILSFFESGTIEGLMSGEYIGTQLTEGFKIISGLTFWIPWIMAWAAMTLNLAINRWANIILGTILGVIGVIILFNEIFINADKSSSAILINYFLGIILHLLIVWYGWKLPKDES